ncbi:MAG: quinone-dependent dihydroorotate dehydrogenase [Bacteroidetes bacterium]|nr:MAG: quinone-dependent dihydroorotate dehydrogenase [Bacteroidota bacterium]
MYTSLLRPLLFLFPPETVHHMVVKMLHAGFMIPGIKGLVKKTCRVQDPLLETELFGIRFPNRVGLAAGFDKQANIYNHLAAFGFGHIEIGTVNPLPQPGNPKPRLFRLKKDKALINRMGFNNPGVDVFVKNLKKYKPEVIIGGNIGKNTLTPNENAIEDYLICYNTLYDWVDYFVINVSCPNIEGLGKLQDKDELIKIITRINEASQQKAIRKPVLLKIAPDLTPGQLDDTINVVETTGIDGIIATNTTTTRDHLATEKGEVEQIGRGGLSGKPLKDKSTQTIKYIVDKSKGRIPVIGVGGIMTPEDAIEKLEAGASLVQIYTGFIYQGPSLVKRLNKTILKYLQ